MFVDSGCPLSILSPFDPFDRPLSIRPFDPKLIAYGSTRTEAIARMKRALDMFVVEGIYTSISLHKKILDHPDFAAGKLDTGFLVRNGFMPEKK